MTGSFDSRLSAIRRGNADTVEVLKTFEGSRDYILSLEQELKIELADENDHYEFFKDGPEIRAALERLDKIFTPENYPPEVSAEQPLQN